MKQKLSAPEDFLLEDRFCEWVASQKKEHHEFWQKWMKENQKLIPVLEEAEQLFKVLHLRSTPEQELMASEHLELAWQSISLQRKAGQKIVPLRRRRFGAIAASIAILVIGGLVLLKLLVGSKSYETPYGKITKVELPDGSTVVLQANSTLKLDRNWKESVAREVWLTGEAYFDITNTPKIGANSFIVHAGNLDINVLGTEFNVINRVGQEQIVLKEGKISLSYRGTTPEFNLLDLSSGKAQNWQEDIVMQPGQLVERKNNEKDYQMKKVANTTPYTSWTRKKWHLQNLKLKEIARKIEDIFGVSISFDDPALEDIQFDSVGEIPVEKLEDLLRGLEVTQDIKALRNKKQITFKAK